MVIRGVLGAVVIGTFVIASVGVTISRTFTVSSLRLQLNSETSPSETVRPVADVDSDLMVALPPVEAREDEKAADPERKTLEIERGDTLSAILARVGVTAEDANALFEALKDHFDPRRIRAGQEIGVTLEPLAETPGFSRLVGMTLAPDMLHRVSVDRTSEGDFVASTQAIPARRQTLAASGDIRSSLFADGERAGVPVAALVSMMRAFSWQVDFQRDIHEGDRFEILYQPLINENGVVVDGNEVPFAALTLNGKRMALYRFTREDGSIDYFDASGKNARRALLRTPVDAARISSRYGMRRHPILGYGRMHKGIDFAAPRGTPIYAAGDGMVAFAGRKGGYGKYVQIKHHSGYATAYAHMHGYAKGIRAGSRVKQGQVIGYVGSTGRSTGPHLHYEILRNGGHLNPLNVKMPAAPKLAGRELTQFRASVAELDRQMQALLGKVDVADATPFR